MDFPAEPAEHHLSEATVVKIIHSSKNYSPFPPNTRSSGGKFEYKN